MKPFFLQECAKGITQISPIDPACSQGLSQNRVVTHNHQRYFVPRGFQSEVLQSQHRKEPYAATNALNSDSLPHEVFGFADAWSHNKLTICPVDDAGKKGNIHPSDSGAQSRSRNSISHLDITRGQGRHGLGTAADVDDLNLYAVPAKEILLNPDPQSRPLFVEDSMGYAH